MLHLVAVLLLACRPPDEAERDPAADSDVPADPAFEARRDAVCAAWTEARADLREGVWTGDLATCDPGDIEDEARDRTLAVLNAWRFVADLPPVGHDADLDAAAQACALLQHANDALEHAPPPDWSCWTEAGASAAGDSNLATTPGTRAIDLYMQDVGADTTMGHRRWMLGEELGPVGVGSTSEFSCLHVTGGSGTSTRPWIAWPPAGPVPEESLHVGSAGGTDAGGWTVQSETIDLDAAQVTVLRDGLPMPVQTNVLLPEYGSDYALRIVPDRWASEAGHRYDVQVGNVSEPFAWSFTFVDCDEAATSE